MFNRKECFEFGCFYNTEGSCMYDESLVKIQDATVCQNGMFDYLMQEDFDECWF